MKKPRPKYRGNISDVDISLLREFMEITEAGGVTAAEPRLNKSKSAISLGLSKLEQRIGIRLCERGRSGFSLTEQGQIIHAATKQLLSEIAQFSDFVGAASRQLDGEISVFVDDSFVVEMEKPLSTTISKLNENYPSLTLKIRMTAPDRILNSVLEGTADLGFTALIRPNDALEIVPAFIEEMGIFCGVEHPLFGKPDSEITYEILQKHSFVRADVFQEQQFSQFLSGLKYMATAPTILSRMLLILSSKYLGFIPIEFAQFWVQKGSIRELIIPHSRAKNQCYIINRKSRPLGMAAGIFKELLTEEVRSYLKDRANSVPSNTKLAHNVAKVK